MSKDGIDYWTQVQDAARKRHEAARIRLDALDAEREEITNEVVQLEQLIKSVAPFTSASPLEQGIVFLIDNAADLTLADACRRTLKNNSRYMKPKEIRFVLEASGLDLKANYTNPLAGIHGVLKRMVASGEVEAHSHEAKGTLYRWKYAVQKGSDFSTERAKQKEIDTLADATVKNLERSKSRAQRIVEDMAFGSGMTSKDTLADATVKNLERSKSQAQRIVEDIALGNGMNATQRLIDEIKSK